MSYPEKFWDTTISNSIEKDFIQKSQLIFMQTIEVSDAAYKKLLSRQLEGESLSSVILRELDNTEEEEGWDVEKLDTHLDNVIKNSKKTYSFEEVFN